EGAPAVQINVKRDDTTSPLSVIVTHGSQSANGADYSETLSGYTVSFGTGESTASFSVTALEDYNNSESDETIVYEFSETSGYTMGSGSQATVTIKALPLVSVEATDPVAIEDVTILDNSGNLVEMEADAGEFTLTRTGNLTASLTVNYSLSGTAKNGEDYME